MSIGFRIRKIRNFRNITQKELGMKCGYHEDSADVSIRQYENGTKVPRADKLRIIAEALGISYSVFKPESVRHEFIENLFWFEEEFGDIDLFSFGCINEKPEDDTQFNWEYRATYNRYNEERWISNTPVGLNFNDPEMNELLNMWLHKKYELKQGLITKDQYFEWKINWPESSVKD